MFDKMEALNREPVPALLDVESPRSSPGTRPARFPPHRSGAAEPSSVKFRLVVRPRHMLRESACVCVCGFPHRPPVSRPPTSVSDSVI